MLKLTISVKLFQLQEKLTISLKLFQLQEKLTISVKLFQLQEKLTISVKLFQLQESTLQLEARPVRTVLEDTSVLIPVQLISVLLGDTVLSEVCLFVFLCSCLFV